MKIVVYHASYGCDSGCCGHVVETDPDDGTGRFDFVHPYNSDHLEFARGMVREQFGDEHVADLDWDNCHISED
jgi:hypothetical protein